MVVRKDRLFSVEFCLLKWVKYNLDKKIYRVRLYI